MAKITPVLSEVFVDRNKSALVQLMNSLWDIQTDTITQDRVLSAIAEQGLPNEWFDELSENIHFFINNQFEPVLAEKTVAAGNGVLSQVDEALGTSLDYTLVSNGLSFVDSEGLKLATMIEEPLRGNVVSILRNSIDNGLNVTETKAMLNSAITLTKKESNAMVNFSLRLSDDLTQKQKASLTAKYYKKLVRNRSERIARTELTRVKHFGEIDSLNQNVGLGNLKGVTKIWNRANFKDNWESSVINDGVEVGLNEEFPEPCATGNAFYPSEINEYCYLDYGVR